MLKKPAQVAPTMSTLHEDANVEEAEEAKAEAEDVMEASLKVPEDKCQLQAASSHRPSALLDKGHVKDHHQLHPQPTSAAASVASTVASTTATTVVVDMVCIQACSFFPTGCFPLEGVRLVTLIMSG